MAAACIQNDGELSPQIAANEYMRMQKQGSSPEATPFELRFAEVMVEMGWATLVPEGFARLLLLSLRR